MTEPAKKTTAKKTTDAPPEDVRYDRPEHRNLATALAAFQGEMPTVHKGKTAKVEKDGRTLYTYEYADLADVTQAAMPVLSRHGLSFSTRPVHLDGLGFVLQGVLRHSSGELDEGLLPIHGRDAQAIGSSITYGRRYLLGCMTGIVTDDDDDGARAAQARAARPETDVKPQRQAQSEPVNQAPPSQAVPPHVQEMWDMLANLSDSEKETMGSWWDAQVIQGHLPPKENSGACTPAQVGRFKAAVAEMREWTATGTADPQGAPDPR